MRREKHLFRVTAWIFVGIAKGVDSIRPKKDWEGANDVTYVEVLRRSWAQIEDFRTKFVAHCDIPIGIINQRTSCLFLAANHFMAVFQGV